MELSKSPIKIVSRYFRKNLSHHPCHIMSRFLATLVGNTTKFVTFFPEPYKKFYLALNFSWISTKTIALTYEGSA